MKTTEGGGQNLKSSQLGLILFKKNNQAILTLKAPITTAADNKFCIIFPNFQKKKKKEKKRKKRQEITCKQTILMKYHALFVIF